MLRYFLRIKKKKVRLSKENGLPSVSILCFLCPQIEKFTRKRERSFGEIENIKIGARSRGLSREIIVSEKSVIKRTY